MTYINRINSSIEFRTKSTLLERTLEQELKQKNRLLGGGIIEYSFKNQMHMDRWIYLRRMTRPNKLKHSLIYLRQIGFGYVNLNQLIKKEFGEYQDKEDRKEEYLCVGRWTPQEIYSTIEFKNQGDAIRIQFDAIDFDTSAWKVERLADNAISVARDIPGEMWEAGVNRTYKIMTRNNLRKIVKELCGSFLKAEYKLYKKVA